MTTILFYIDNKKSLNSKKLGGIESLNVDLYNQIKKINNKTFLSNKITKQIKKKEWDYIISSNDAKVFNKIKCKNKILWLHNKLQIEKAIRKKQILPILFNKITAVFNSKYLKNNTSPLYNFQNKLVISNFLTKDFYNLKNNFKRKPNFIWSVQRSKGLDKIVDEWIDKIYLKNNKLKLYIFGIQNPNINKYNLKKLERFNIYFKGRVNKNELKKYYQKSMAMICLGYDETFSLNVLESFSCGLPVITFGYTAVSELVNIRNSFMLKKYSNLSNIVFRISEHKYKKKLMISNYCINFSKNFYIDKQFHKWKNLLRL